MHSISYSTLQYYMFLVMKEIRGKSTNELAQVLLDRLAAQEETFNNSRFSMHKMNRYMVHRMLARMTDTIEIGSGQASHYLEYINRESDPKNPYEVEHVWADHPERHNDEFGHPTDFREYRNRIGGLLLLQKKFNASYNDLPYEDKHKHYIEQNFLAKSLHPLFYEKNPGFRDFIIKTGIPFKSHEHFKEADLDERQSLYITLAEYTWRPERLTEAMD